MNQGERELKEWVPKDLMDSRTQTITLDPIKKILEKQEATKEDLLQTYKTEITRLHQEIEGIRKEGAQLDTIKYFWKSLSLHCLQTNTKLNILQCAHRLRKVECKGCSGRDEILSKMEARNR